MFTAKRMKSRQPDRAKEADISQSILLLYLVKEVS